MLRRILRKLAWMNVKYIPLYRKFGKPSGPAYADLLRHHNALQAIGRNCSIIPDTIISDPKYVKLGDNVRLASCTLLGHDGVVNMLNRAYGLRLDAVGKIEIGNNVFVGYKAIILRNVTIGDNCVIAAGAVVTQNIPSNSVVGGVPAKFICHTDQLVEKLQKENESFPWKDLILSRNSDFDPVIEPELMRQRVRYFYMNE